MVWRRNRFFSHCSSLHWRFRVSLFVVISVFCCALKECCLIRCHFRCLARWLRCQCLENPWPCTCLTLVLVIRIWREFLLVLLISILLSHLKVGVRIYLFSLSSYSISRVFRTFHLQMRKHCLSFSICICKGCHLKCFNRLDNDNLLNFSGLFDELCLPLG